MLLKLIALMTIVPAVELVLLLQVHGWLAQVWGGGFALLFTVGLILMTGVIGAALARSQGFVVMKRLSDVSRQGVIPTDEILDGVLVFVGGVLLLTPGFLSDAFGFLLLIPASRLLFRRYLRQAVTAAMERGTVGFQFYQAGGGFSSNHSHREQTIDVEYIEPDAPRKP